MSSVLANKYLIILALFAIFSGTIQAETIEVTNFHGETQGSLPWCWAASTEMALAQFGYAPNGVPKRTCDVVSDQVGVDCCVYNTPTQCMVGGSDEFAFSQYYLAVMVRKASAESVLLALRANRVAVLLLLNTDRTRSGHEVVVYGALDVEKGDDMILEIYDPARGPMRRTVSSLLRNGYQVGNNYLTRQFFDWTEVHYLYNDPSQSSSQR